MIQSVHQSVESLFYLKMTQKYLQRYCLTAAKCICTKIRTFCKQVEIIPMTGRFILNDVILFHKIFNNLTPIRMPDYLPLFNGLTCLRSCHLDRLCFVSSVLPKGKSSNILNIISFFFRSHMMLNSLTSGNKGTQGPRYI